MFLIDTNIVINWYYYVFPINQNDQFWDLVEEHIFAELIKTPNVIYDEEITCAQTHGSDWFSREEIRSRIMLNEDSASLSEVI